MFHPTVSSLYIILLATSGIFLMLLVRRARRQLKKSEALFHGVLDIAGDAIISVNSAQTILIFNKGAENIFGYRADEVLGRSLELLIPPRFRATHDQHLTAFAKLPHDAHFMDARQSIYGLRKNGEEFPAEASISKLGTDEGIVYTAILRDITERRVIEQRLQASLQEKNVLLKEVHHRVKNNLQIISSLLSLQSRQTKDEKALESIKESQNRVHSIALIHEMLYRATEQGKTPQATVFSRLNFQEYVKSLTANLLRSYGLLNSVCFNIETHDITLSLDSAIPCGLIINELVSNCMKHAFHSMPNGKIAIELSQLADRQLNLSVSDNGCGFPPDIDYLETETLGLRLVKSLCQQLEGTMELKTNQGTRVTVSFTDAS